MPAESQLHRQVIRKEADAHPIEVHVLAGGVKPAKQVVRDVQSVAMAQFDLDIDHRIVSVVQIPDDSVEVGGGRRAHRLAFSEAARPARRPKTTHSSSELPIMRLRPWVPPAISPQAYRPSSVVSACSSITRPPFW